MSEQLRFLPFETVADAAFWHGLAKKKLEEYRLSEGPFPLTASYNHCVASGLNPRVVVDATAFPGSSIIQTNAPGNFVLFGKILPVNTLDRFKEIDKQSLINDFGTKMFASALKGALFMDNPSLLMQFLLLVFCDLKHHKFFFWFAYPAVLSQNQPMLLSTRVITDVFSEKQLSNFLSAYDSWRSDHTDPFFVVQKPAGDEVNLMIDRFSGLNLESSESYIGFCDPSTDAKYPGWSLRNILFALSTVITKQRQIVHILCFRERYAQGHRQVNHSLVLDVELTSTSSSSFTQFVGWEKYGGQLKPQVANLSSSMDPVKLAESAVDLNLKLMRWRLIPDLKLETFRQAKCLLIGAGTLGCNVARQLMAWGVRHISLIDNGSVSMSNPVRQSLFVFDDAKDGGKSKAVAAAKALEMIFPGVCARGVELTIPMPGHPVGCSSVNDPVFNADKLPKSLNSHTDDGSLCLPAAVFDAYNACSRLSDLINSHDVLFLLTDTRESRWLPTLLANVHGKLVINAALGFDTYLVMRHGVASAGISPSNFVASDPISNLSISNPEKPVMTGTSSACGDSLISPHTCKTVSGSNLGCYFCNDVVGPTNSTQNRSLDQQCTVTRPGVSMIAAALAVELFISIMQHPLGPLAPARLCKDEEAPELSSLGSSFALVPHQIRGFISKYSQILPTTSAFKHCSACSQVVLDAFKRDGFAFLLRVFNDANYLEHVSGLADLQRMTEESEVIAFSDSEEVESV